MILIVAVLFAFVVAFFATQNTTITTLHLANYVFSGVPLYMVMLVALFIGLCIAGIVNLFYSINSTLAIRGKDSHIRKANDTIFTLRKQIDELRSENANLRAEEGQSVAQQTTEEENTTQRPHPWFENLRHSF